MPSAIVAEDVVLLFDFRDVTLLKLNVYWEIDHRLEVK